MLCRPKLKPKKNMENRKLFFAGICKEFFRMKELYDTSELGRRMQGVLDENDTHDPDYPVFSLDEIRKHRDYFIIITDGKDYFRIREKLVRCGAKSSSICYWRELIDRYVVGVSNNKEDYSISISENGYIIHCLNHVMDNGKMQLIDNGLNIDYSDLHAVVYYGNPVACLTKNRDCVEFRKQLKEFYSFYRCILEQTKFLQNRIYACRTILKKGFVPYGEEQYYESSYASKYGYKRLFFDNSWDWNQVYGDILNLCKYRLENGISAANMLKNIKARFPDSDFDPVDLTKELFY